MRIAFAGTPEFAAYSLKALIDAGHNVAFVLTQPDRPAGRGLKLLPSAVKQVAEENSILVHQPQSLQASDVAGIIENAAIDCLIVAAYGLIIPPKILAMPKYGCLNIHASLLPRWRGAAPIQRAILQGDEKTGICIMQMEKGLDTGPVVALETIAIASDDTASSLHDKLKEAGASLIKQVIACLETGELLTLTVQSNEGIIYAEKLKKEEAVIDWGKSANEIDRQVRAFNPFPIAQTSLFGEIVRIWAGNVDLKNDFSSNSQPGTIVHLNKEKLTVACGNGFFNITELQKAGGKRLNSSAFLSGNKVNVGDSFYSSKTITSSSHSS